MVNSWLMAITFDSAFELWIDGLRRTVNGIRPPAKFGTCLPAEAERDGALEDANGDDPEANTALGPGTLAGGFHRPGRQAPLEAVPAPEGCRRLSREGQ